MSKNAEPKKDAKTQTHIRQGVLLIDQLSFVINSLPP